MKQIRIGIIGNIGVGKSTLVKFLQNQIFEEINLPVKCFFESFENDDLDEFYKNPQDKSFTQQMKFLNSRLLRSFKMEDVEGIIIEDRTLAEDFHIFGQAQKIMNYMTDYQFRIYRDTFNLMSKKFVEPDLYIYLKGNPETLKERIYLRGRQSEKTIPLSYLTQLNSLYEIFVHEKTTVPVIEFETDSITNVDNFHQIIYEKLNQHLIRRNFIKKTPLSVNNSFEIISLTKEYLRSNDIKLNLIGSQSFFELFSCSFPGYASNLTDPLNEDNLIKLFSKQNNLIVIEENNLDVKKSLELQDKLSKYNLVKLPIFRVNTSKINLYDYRVFGRFLDDLLRSVSSNF